MINLEKCVDILEPALADLFDQYHTIIQRYLEATDDSAKPEDVRKAFRTLLSACILTVLRNKEAEPLQEDVRVKLIQWLGSGYRDNMLFLFDKSRKKKMTPQEYAWRSHLVWDEKSIAEELRQEEGD